MFDFPKEKRSAGGRVVKRRRLGFRRRRLRGPRGAE